MSSSCSHCGKPAELSVRRTDAELDLCRECFRKSPDGGVLRILDGMRRPAARAGQCPHCGWTKAKLDAAGLVGCPLCYEAIPEAAPGTA
jgi:protein-arginine kinase activator protein McsA